MRNIVFYLHVKELFPSILRNVSAIKGCSVNYLDEQ